jgi:membrane-associated phospholipid phosphatase
MNIRRIIDRQSKFPGAIFIIAYLLILLPAFILSLIWSKELIHISINNFHSAFFDSLMKYWTYLGDGVLLVILILGLLLISFRHFFTALTAYSFGGIGAQIMKRLFFKDSPRPIKYFELYFPEHQLYLVPGVDVHTWFSFPSGHSATAFAVFFALACFTKSKIAQLSLLILALGVGFSRIYLSEHFLEDVLAGSVLGVIMGCLAFRAVQGIKKSWIDLSLINILKR